MQFLPFTIYHSNHTWHFLAIFWQQNKFIVTDSTVHTSVWVDPRMSRIEKIYGQKWYFIKKTVCSKVAKKIEKLHLVWSLSLRFVLLNWKKCLKICPKFLGNTVIYRVTTNSYSRRCQHTASGRKLLLVNAEKYHLKQRFSIKITPRPVFYHERVAAKKQWSIKISFTFLLPLKRTF